MADSPPSPARATSGAGGFLVYPLATPPRSRHRPGGRSARRDPPDVVQDAALARTLVRTPDDTALERTARQRLANIEDFEMRQLLKQREAVAAVRGRRAVCACVCVRGA